MRKDKDTETTHQAVASNIMGPSCRGEGIILTATKTAGHYRGRPKDGERLSQVPCTARLSGQHWRSDHSQISVLLFGQPPPQPPQRVSGFDSAFWTWCGSCAATIPTGRTWTSSSALCSQESRDAVNWLEDKVNRRAMQLHSVDRTEFDNFSKIIPTPMEPLGGSGRLGR